LTASPPPQIIRGMATWTQRIATAILLLAAAPARAALLTTDVSAGVSAESLVDSILGRGVNVSNVAYRGCPAGAGTFSGGAAIIGFEGGIVLSSGSVAAAVGPNTDGGISTICDAAGDTDLTALIPGSETQDASVLEFDFVPAGSTVTFQYVFASEEYPEYVGSQFNDVFGFFVNGVNQALIPGTTTPVAINNVNNVGEGGGANPLFFVDNACTDGVCARDTQADGLTQILSFTAQVVPNQTNHIKLAIADAGDPILDSWVFIAAGTLSATSAQLTDPVVRGNTARMTVTIADTGKGAGMVEAAGFARALPADAAVSGLPQAVSGPAGLERVTKPARVRFRKGRATVKLKLNALGRRLLKESSSGLQVLAVVQVTERDRTVQLQRLFTILRGRR
jgi:hypothetical protein